MVMLPFGGASPHEPANAAAPVAYARVGGEEFARGWALL